MSERDPLNIQVPYVDEEGKNMTNRNLFNIVVAPLRSPITPEPPIPPEINKAATQLWIVAEEIGDYTQPKSAHRTKESAEAECARINKAPGRLWHHIVEDDPVLLKD